MIPNVKAEKKALPECGRRDHSCFSVVRVNLDRMDNTPYSIAVCRDDQGASVVQGVASNQPPAIQFL